MLYHILRRCPRILFLLALCCILVVTVPAGAAVPVSREQPAPRTLSATEALLLAKNLLEQNRPDDAEKIYTALRNNPSEEIRIEAAFQLAHIWLRQGRYRQGISLFHEILNRQPGLTRVRLDLARAYFLDKNYEDATFHFELVKGGDLPPEVLANVDGFLDAIRRQKNWTWEFSFSPVFDSNISQASGGKEECIDTEFGTLCRPLEEKNSGMGLSASASVDHFWRFHQDWGLRSTVGFSGTAYEQNKYDDYSFYVASGPRYLWDNGEASVQPFFRKRWIGAKEYSEEFGLRWDVRQINGRFILDAGASYNVVNYAEAYVHNILKGSVWTLRLQPRFILTDRTFVQAGLDFLREDTEARDWTNNSWRYSIGAYHAFAYGISLFAGGSFTQTRYASPQWYVTRDNRIDETTRKDNIWQFFASLSSNTFERYGLTPMLQYVHTKRESNIWTREYTRNQLFFLLNYKF